jgi:ABC-2 type transport system permease protein
MVQPAGSSWPWLLGFALAAFFLNLILTSWRGLRLRRGDAQWLGAENLARTVMFLLMRLSCVYYPVSVLPHWLQIVAWSLPLTCVLEGMRAHSH